MQRILPSDMVVGGRAYLLAALLLVPVNLLFSAMFLALAAFARDFKDGQNVLMPVYLPLTMLSGLASLPGMRERTIQISSAGKTFSCTGWKVGWACGPADLVSAVLRVKQFLTFVNAGPFQPAVAHALGLPREYFESLRAELLAKRDLLVRGLAKAGFEVFVPEGAYYVTADITPLGGTDGLEFCRALPERCGVVAVPTQVFYDDAAAGAHLVRFAFCKRTEVLAAAVSRLATLS